MNKLIIAVVAALVASLTPLASASAAAASTVGGGAARAPSPPPRSMSVQPWQPWQVVTDAQLSSTGARTVLRAANWGGTLTTSTGEKITMYASSWYYVNVGWLQGWADWMATYMPHKDEFSRLTVLFVPPSQLGVCGAGAAGCYSPSQALMVVPGNNLPDGTMIRTVIVHEYGHHVAANRQNPPWSATAWGPKYWATYAGVCGRVAAGTAFPGDEGINYLLNPGEAWAETYRLMMWRSWTWLSVWPEDGWNSDRTWYPDFNATSAARRDVLDPYTAGATRDWSGRFTKARRAFSTRLDTPYDGTLNVTLYRPIGGVLTLIDGGTGAIIGNTSASFSYTVCGARFLKLRIAGKAKQRFQVNISAP